MPALFTELVDAAERLPRPARRRPATCAGIRYVGTYGRSRRRGGRTRQPCGRSVCVVDVEQRDAVAASRGTTGRSARPMRARAAGDDGDRAVVVDGTHGVVSLGWEKRGVARRAGGDGWNRLGVSRRSGSHSSSVTSKVTQTGIRAGDERAAVHAWPSGSATMPVIDGAQRAVGLRAHLAGEAHDLDGRPAHQARRCRRAPVKQASTRLPSAPRTNAWRKAFGDAQLLDAEHEVFVRRDARIGDAAPSSRPRRGGCQTAWADLLRCGGRHVDRERPHQRHLGFLVERDAQLDAVERRREHRQRSARRPTMLRVDGRCGPPRTAAVGAGEGRVAVHDGLAAQPSLPKRRVAEDQRRDAGPRSARV